LLRERVPPHPPAAGSRSGRPERSRRRGAGYRDARNGAVFQAHRRARRLLCPPRAAVAGRYRVAAEHRRLAEEPGRTWKYAISLGPYRAGPTAGRRVCRGTYSA